MTRRWLRGAWALALAMGMLRSTEARAEVGATERSVAIVVGNNLPPSGEGGEGLVSLRYADDDAQRYAEMFRHFADQTVLLTVLDRETRVRYPDEHVDGPPTLVALRRAVAALEQQDPETTVYLVFSGHGAIGDTGEPYLALLDGSLTRAVLFDEILARIPASRVHVIIDACHAAGVVGLRGRRFGSQVDGKTAQVSEEARKRWVEQNTLDRFPHVGVLASTSTGESAHEWSVLEAGVFSHELLSGMWGAADVNGDQRIEYSELQSFVAAANRAIDDPRAKPSVVARSPPLDPHAVVIDLARFRNTAMLTGDASSLGHFHVELSNGRRHLDGNLSAPSVTLVVPAGEAFVRAHDREFSVQARAGSSIQLASLPAQPLDSVARGGASSAFRRALFAEPYTPDYYRGYVDVVGATSVRFDARAKSPVATQTVQPPSPRAVLGPKPPPADRPPRSRPDNRARDWGIAALVVASGAGLTSLSTGVAAAVVRSRFNDTDVERDAHALDDRHRTLAAVAISTLVVAAVTATLGGLLLRSHTRRRAGPGTSR